MTDSCPTCGQELPSDLPLRVDLEANVAVANGVAVCLSEKQAELLSLVASTGYRTATYGFLLDNLYLLDERDPDILKVMMCNIRKKLAKTGVSVETVWGKGYRIVQKKAA